MATADIKTSRSIIRISRDGEVEENSLVAIRILDLYTHVPGQMVMVRYYTDESRTKIDNMLALGLKHGVGSDCYQIITPFNKTIIWGVAKTMSEVDVAKFPTGKEKYIYLDQESGKAKYVTVNSNGERVFTLISDGPRAYEDISTGRTFYLDAYNWDGGGEGAPSIDPSDVRDIAEAVFDERIVAVLNQYFTKEQIEDLLDGKVDKLQGIENANKYLTVDSTGYVQPNDLTLNWIEN
jgi:hypothetical protein